MHRSLFFLFLTACVVVLATIGNQNVVRAAEVEGGTYHAIVGFNAWLNGDPTLAASRLRDLRNKVGSNDSGDWRLKWLAAWDREVDMVSRLSADSRNQFLTDLVRTKDVLIQFSSVADHRSLEAELSKHSAGVTKILDDKCPTYFLMLEFQAIIESSNGKFAQAKETFASLRRKRAKHHGNDNPLYASDSENLALCNIETGDVEEARSCLMECLKIREVASEVPSSMVTQTTVNIAVLDVKVKQYEAAVTRLTKVLAKQSLSETQGNLIAAVCYHQLGTAYANTSQSVNAEESFNKGLKEYRKLLHPAHPTVLKIMSEQAVFYESSAQPEKARELRTAIESLKIRWKVIDKQA